MPYEPGLISPRFPRAARYHPAWIRASVSGGAHSLWLTEWLADAMDLRPGARVLDLGCGQAASSIFLHREFGVQVWAVDLWFGASDNLRRIRDAGVGDAVFPVHADARNLPFGAEFFDAVVCIDAYPYFGTDDLYLSLLARFIRPGAPIGIAGAGLTREIEGDVPEQLAGWWTPDLWVLHSAEWWRRHWERTGMVDIEVADTMVNGWELWRDWQRAIAPGNTVEIEAVETDAGRYLGYVRLVARRRAGMHLEEPVVSIRTDYTHTPLLREGDLP